MSAEEDINELVVRFAVIEQLLINVAGAMSSEPDNPSAMVAAIINDLQAQFALEPDGNADMRAFKTNALRQVLRVGQRLQQVTEGGTQH